MDDLMLVAKSPAEMQEAQLTLVKWVAEKIISISSDLREAKTNLQTAVVSKIRTTGWRTRVSKLRKQLDFYSKVEAAVNEGYYIVPPFPINVIAIRTATESPAHFWQSEHKWELSRQPARPDILAPGEGKYVAPTMTVVPSEVYVKPYGSDKAEWRKGWRTKDWREVDFPFKMAKPMLLESLSAAMKQKVFDQIGLVQQAPKTDPVLIGQIFSPEKNRPPINFFIAWWLDTRDLR